MGVPKPFERVVRANIGDCHALGQQPFTFIRQVVALASCPQLISSVNIPLDVKDRVRDILADCSLGSVGAYSLALGLRSVRERAAAYMRARDAVPASYDDVCVGSGASDVIKSVLAMFTGKTDGKPPAVMIPIPQYPLFSGTLSELGISATEYYFDEENNWALSIEELNRSWREASQTTAVRALVVINSGNPTGKVLDRENMEEVIKFAYCHDLFLLADEVYQENIVSKPFFSFKKVMNEMGSPYSSMELGSFASGSKGWAAECGLRAGYVELLRLAPRVRSAFTAAKGVMQCPNVLGQCALDCIVPILYARTSGEPSYPQFSRELAAVRRTRTERAAAAYRAFNTIPGNSCNPINGAMFAFPRFEIPARAQAVAQEKNMAPDEFYCLRLLEETGVCVVPGTGFGQIPGTFHFRTTILHSQEEFQHMMDSISSIHQRFLVKYA